MISGTFTCPPGGGYPGGTYEEEFALDDWFSTGDPRDYDGSGTIAGDRQVEETNAILQLRAVLRDQRLALEFDCRAISTLRGFCGCA